MPDYNQIRNSDFKPRQRKGGITQNFAQTLNEMFPTLVGCCMFLLGFEEETTAQLPLHFPQTFPRQHAFIWLAAGESCHDSQVTHLLHAMLYCSKDFLFQRNLAGMQLRA